MGSRRGKACRVRDAAGIRRRRHWVDFDDEAVVIRCPVSGSIVDGVEVELTASRSSCRRRGRVAGAMGALRLKDRMGLSGGSSDTFFT